MHSPLSGLRTPDTTEFSDRIRPVQYGGLHCCPASRSHRSLYGWFDAIQERCELFGAPVVGVDDYPEMHPAVMSTKLPWTPGQWMVHVDWACQDPRCLQRVVDLGGLAITYHSMRI